MNAVGDVIGFRGLLRWAARELPRLGRGLSGGLLLGSLVLAPWLYGSTRTWAVEGMTALLAAATLAWLGASILESDRVRVPRSVLWWSGWLVALSAVGLWFRPEVAPEARMAAQFLALQHDRPENFIRLSPWQAWAFVFALLGGLCALTDLAADPRWWKRFTATILFTGSSIAALGLYQALSGDGSLLWPGTSFIPSQNFATFNHYIQAGAFLNLTWPIGLASVLGLLCERLRKGWRAWILAAAFSGLSALTWVALLNQRSRAAQALGVLVLGALVVAGWIVSKDAMGRGAPRDTQLRRGWLMILIGAFSVGAIAIQTPMFKTTLSRWQTLFVAIPAEAVPRAPVDWDAPRGADRLLVSDDPTRNEFLWDRRLAWATAWRMIRERPWLGYGLRGWTRNYHRFTDDAFLKTFFLYLQFTHQDSLQMLVEWGVLGALGWAALIGGGLWRCWRELKAGPQAWDLPAWQCFGILASLVTLFCHGLADYPLQVPALQWYAAALLGLLWVRRPPLNAPL